MPAERPSIFDLCPTCLNPKPCVLHDQMFMEELLHPEEQPPDIEKTREWEYGDNILSICSMPDGSALVGGIGGKIMRADKNGTTLKDVGEYGNAIWSICPMPDGSALVGGIGGKIMRLDKNGTTLKDVGEYGNDIWSISLAVDFSTMKKSI